MKKIFKSNTSDIIQGCLIVLGLFCMFITPSPEENILMYLGIGIGFLGLILLIKSMTIKSEKEE